MIPLGKQLLVRDTKIEIMMNLPSQRIPLLTSLATLLLVAGFPFAAAGQTAALDPSGSQRIDSSAVAQTVDRFYAALVDGDSTAVAHLLAPDAIILEGGARETRTEYLGHHFHSDHAFLSAVERKTSTREIRLEGKTAWVTSTGRMHGTYDGQSYNLSTAGLLVLRRKDGNWRIQAIHWSSRSRQ